MIKRVVVLVSLIIIVLDWTCVSSAITLGEAIDLALKNNHKVREYDHRYDVQESRVGSDLSPFWPKLDVTYDYEKHENAFSFQTKESSTFTALASYNLFNGFRDILQLKSSRSELDASEYEMQANSADVILDVKRAYINVLRASENLKVSRVAVELLQRQRRDAELFFKSGLTAKNELLKVEVELASAQQDLLRNERNLNVLIQTLARRIGIGISDDEKFVDIGEPRQVLIDQNTLEQMMLERRSELKYLKARVEAREYVSRSERGRYLPSIDLSYFYNRFGENNAFEGRDDPLFDDDEGILVTATWNLFEGFRTWHDMNAEASEALAQEESLLDTMDDLSLQLKAALAEYNVSQNHIAVSRKAVTQAEENYRITENQFKQRVATTTDLLDARFLLTRAQTDYNNSLYNLHLAIAALERIVEVKDIGDILQLPEKHPLN